MIAPCRGEEGAFFFPANDESLEASQKMDFFELAINNEHSRTNM
jgi:hypothetical protein